MSGRTLADGFTADGNERQIIRGGTPRAECLHVNQYGAAGAVGVRRGRGEDGLKSLKAVQVVVGVAGVGDAVSREEQYLVGPQLGRSLLVRAIENAQRNPAESLAEQFDLTVCGPPHQ